MLKNRCVRFPFLRKSLLCFVTILEVSVDSPKKINKAPKTYKNYQKN